MMPDDPTTIWRMTTVNVDERQLARLLLIRICCEVLLLLFSAARGLGLASVLLFDASLSTVSTKGGHTRHACVYAVKHALVAHHC